MKDTIYREIEYKRGDVLTGRDCPDSVGHWVGVLFEQNPGLNGVTLTFGVNDVPVIVPVAEPVKVKPTKPKK